MVKKISALLLTVSLLICTTACDGLFDKTENVSVSKLEEYTIIYPSGYSEWKMTEVELLKDVIKHITGKEITAVPDTEVVEGKKIILGSSSVENKYSEEIAGFANAMCYVIGVDGDNIVLGGKNYYSDMRAIYDLVNNTLGYDDLTDTYSDPQKKIKGEKTVLWDRPKFRIMGSNMSCNPFSAAWQVKDYSDCNFNILYIATNMRYFDPENVYSIRNMAKWATRFGIETMLLPDIDWTNNVITLEDEDDIRENPGFWGFYVSDEPAEELMEALNYVIINSKEKYKDLDWKYFVNTGCGYISPEIDDPELSGAEVNSDPAFINLWYKYFTASDVFSFDQYNRGLTQRNNYICYLWEELLKRANEKGIDFHSFIEAYNIKNANYNYTKLFRTQLYFAKSFDSDMICYFQYGDASPYYKREGDWSEGSLVNYDFSKNKYYDYAKIANAEMMKVSEILSNYEHKGNFSDNRSGMPFAYIDKPIANADDYVKVIKNTANSDILFGCFEKKDESGKALLLTNIDALDNYDYDKSKNEFIEDYSSDTVKEKRYKISGTATTKYFPKTDLVLDFGGKNVKCYKDGEIYEMTDNKNGTYTVPLENGDCYLFTME